MTALPDISRLPGMKQEAFTKCLCCGKGMAHAGDLTFLRVRFDYLALNAEAIQRQHGMEIAFGPMARILGPNDDMAKVVSSAEGLICGTCMIRTQVAPFSLFESATT